MNILGFDTATAASAACVVRSDGEAFEVAPEPGALGEPPAHARELMPAIAHTMSESGLDWTELDAVAVGTGPGSFTGLRIGVATARSLASALKLGLRRVSSLAALAAGAGSGAVLATIDAKRGELFAALYEDGAERWAPFVATPEAVAQRVSAEGRGVVAVGDGSIRFAGLLMEAGAEVPQATSTLHVVRALHVCGLGADTPEVAPEAVEPDYLRAPDARPITQ
jgi:tRNA threonylcarbamoyladenosine biosynthesis protein TsaB